MKVAKLSAMLSVALACAGCGGSTDATPAGRTNANPTGSRTRAAAHATPPRGGHGDAGAGARLGHRRKASGCRVRGSLPDASCTPGSIVAQATVARICSDGYARAVRNVPESLRAIVYADYGIARAPRGAYQVDHLVPLELGGSNSIANLWPEAAPGFHQKDGVENELHAAVCSGSMTLRDAQQRIAVDWRTAGGAVRTYSPVEARPPRPTPLGSSDPASNANFCATHVCIANFSHGRGTIIQCADGEWSHSGGLTGACSRHGGPKG